MYYYLKKLGGLLLTMIIVSLITFGVFQILPGNPAYIILGVDADPLQIEALEETLGLNLPLHNRYANWVIDLLSGDLGNSLRYQQPVKYLLQNAFEVTATLAIISIMLTILIGLPIGLWIAKNSSKKISVPISMLSQLSLSVPSFCMGIFMIAIFTVKLNIFPSMGFIPFNDDPIECIRILFLPSLSISLGSSAVLIRYIRTSVGNQEKQEYVKTAYSKGLNTNQVIQNHVLRNSMIPVITILGLITADILGGSIIVENVFSLPGIGKLISTSISSRDLPLLQGLVLYLAGIVVCCNFLVDIVYSLVDPRIRLK